MSAENIQFYLDKAKTLVHYEKDFRVFWAFCAQQAKKLPDLSMEELALQLGKIHQIKTSVAKNSYSAIVALPGYDSLRFSPLLKSFKRDWNYSSVKYATFWDAQPVLRRLLVTPFRWDSVVQVRDRLVVSLRLVQLFRSIHLARCWRTISQVGEDFFLSKSKGKEL